MLISTTHVSKPTSVSIAEITPKIMEFFEKGLHEASVSIDEVCRDLSIDEWLGWDEEFDNRVKGVWLEHWLCTDTWVGTSAILLDGKLFGFCQKAARKSDANFSWLDTASVDALTAFVMERVLAHRQPADNSVDTPPTEITLFALGFPDYHYKCFV